MSVYDDLKGKNDLVEIQNPIAILLSEADKGSSYAQTELGRAYEYGINIDSNLHLAEVWYRKAAVSGYSTAQVALADMFIGGKTETLNIQKAGEWYRKAANQGDVDAQMALGARLSNHDIPRLYKSEDFDWFLKAAEQDNKYGCSNECWNKLLFKR